MKVESDATTDIRWVSLEYLKQMLDKEKELFFSFVYEALKEYVKYK